MKIRKTTAKLMAFLLAVCMLATTALAYDGIYTDKEGNISYSPYEQGLYSNGGYTIDKVSHPTLGAGEVDGILTGDLQDRGQSYSWSMAEAGDYVYIGTCYNSTYYIYHNNVKTTLDGMTRRTGPFRSSSCRSLFPSNQPKMQEERPWLWASAVR